MGRVQACRRHEVAIDLEWLAMTLVLMMAAQHF